MKKLSEGAEARVFETEIFGKTAVVKVRHEKKYRIKELDVNLRKTRTRREARAMQKAQEAGVNVPMLIGLGEFSIYMEKFSGTLLKDIHKRKIPYGKIGNMLAKMHNANVIHGDFTPANIMMSGSELCIIDFGLSEISNSMENKAIDLLLMKRSMAKTDYKSLEASYVKECTTAKQIISRLANIEKRGRYQIRTLA